jgi:hypothetical protein
VLLIKVEGCEEGLGNPEGTMVMEDNQTTPPPEPTEEPAEQHRTTYSLTEVSPLNYCLYGNRSELVFT